jgi:uncharacterized membrane protein YhhN
MRNQSAPRGVTILIAVLLVVVGVAGTFLGLIPDIGGVSGETAGIVAYVAATVVMLIGIFVRGV